MFDLKPDFAASQQRIQAFWEKEILDRPVVQFSLYKPRAEWRPYPPAPHRTPAERWLDADFQAEWAEVDLANQLFLGDSLPVAWPNLGPDVFASFYGCPLTFGDYRTSWSSPILASWEQAEDIHLDWENPYFQAIQRLTEALLQRGEGKFLTGLTDLHPGGDCLAALRGPQNLALDLVTRPEEVKRLLQRLEVDFQQVYQRFYQRLRRAGLPISTWTPLVCEGKYYLPSNDFSIMISPRMFEDFFLPGIVEECRFLDRSLYHLDGPGALRHLDCLLAIPELDAIQFVPTEGDAAFAKWVGVYQRIQAAGKGLQVTCHISEVDQVIQALQPQGVYLAVQGVPSQEAAQEMLKEIERWCLRRS